ncbi:MAG: NAD-dependent epimerase/dehydratase family protein [Candidatus Limnocylindrales bacterium]|nr:NAD-dependent epimerase/dehydratase family protein [Candidatus Limnocylindrales bacterium]
MRVLVTGGAGFIGSHIVDLLVSRGDDVTVLDDLSTGSRSHLGSNVRLIQSDIRKPDIVEEILRAHPEGIVHAAAQVSVPRSVADPVDDATGNIIGTIRIAQAAAEAKCRSFVFLSSGGAIYGPDAAIPSDEHQPIHPISPYGLSKLSAERYVRMLVGGQIPTTILRLANVYGPRQDPRGEAGVVAVFCAAMRERRELTIDGDGKQTRDFVYVRDIADAAVAALGADQSTTLNIGTGSEVSVNQLFETLADAAGYQIPARHGPAREQDVRRSALDATQASAVLGWRPETALRDGLLLTYAASQGP